MNGNVTVEPLLLGHKFQTKYKCASCGVKLPHRHFKRGMKTMNGAILYYCQPCTAKMTGQRRYGYLCYSCLFLKETNTCRNCGSSMKWRKLYCRYYQAKYFIIQSHNSDIDSPCKAFCPWSHEHTGGVAWEKRNHSQTGEFDPGQHEESGPKWEYAQNADS
jgi:hypothetical protein